MSFDPKLASRPVNRMAGMHTSGGSSPERLELEWDQAERMHNFLQEVHCIQHCFTPRFRLSLKRTFPHWQDRVRDILKHLDRCIAECEKLLALPLMHDDKKEKIRHDLALLRKARGDAA